MADDVLFVGHSLVGHTMPRMLDGLLPAAQARQQVINGAPLAYNWDHGASAEGVNARAELATGDYGTLILTEAIPLAGHIQWSNTHGIALNYAQTAWAANPATRVMIYETWHDIGADPALWRAALTSDLALWRGIANHVNASKPGAAPEVGLVPGGQAMGLLYDTISAGRGMGLTDIRQIFTDSIHLNDSGNYLISLVQYSAITGRSVVGLTDRLTNDWGQPYTGWSPAETVLFQHIAWEAAARAPGAQLAPGAALPLMRLGAMGNDTLTGNDGDDRLYGNRGFDQLSGARGRDLLDGERGNDRILGGSGNDWLQGGAGDDSLTGGRGADTFAFTKGDNADHLTDFSQASGDQLMLDDALWTGSHTAAQVVSSFATVTADGVLFDFGTNGTIFLQGLTTTAGLAGQVEVF